MGGRARYDQREWDKFRDYWADLIEEWPDAKRAALREAGKAALAEVLSQIGKRGVNDPRGRVHRWQGMRVGSRGGYVAVSPVSEALPEDGSGKTTSRDVVRYLEKGHSIRPPGGRARRKYVPRIKKCRMYVPGKQFYSWAKLNATELAIEAGNRALEQFSDDIDNGR